MDTKSGLIALVGIAAGYAGARIIDAIKVKIACRKIEKACSDFYKGVEKAIKNEKVA